MGSEVPDRMGPSAPREAAQQCLIRDVNEDAERLNASLTVGAARTTLRCECGDVACQTRVSLSHDEYEAVRAYGSHFLVGLNHENPESAWVLRENEHFAVIDVVAGDARYHVLGRNPRHAWVDAQDRSNR
jgi:hypothetical protein